MEMPNVSYEVTKGVGKVVQELQGIMELWSCWRQCMLVVHWVGDDCHWDGGGWVGRQGGVQGGKDGRQVFVIRHVFHFTSEMFFAMGDDLSYGLNTLGPLCLWQCLQNSRSSISYFHIPIFLVIRIVFHFTTTIPTILLWPSASATCIYDIDTNCKGLL